MLLLSGTISKTTARTGSHATVLICIDCTLAQGHTLTGGIQGLHCWQNRNCVECSLEVEKPPDMPRSREAEKPPNEPRIWEAKKPKSEISFLHRASKNAPNLWNSSSRKVAQAQYERRAMSFCFLGGCVFVFQPGFVAFVASTAFVGVCVCLLWLYHALPIYLI